MTDKQIMNIKHFIYAIIGLLVITFISISNVSALQLNDLPPLDDLYNTINNLGGSYKSACRNGIAIVKNNNNYYAYCNSYSFFGASSTTSISNNFTLDRTSNYYNIDKLYTFLQNQTIMRQPSYQYIYDRVDQRWTFNCSTNVQTYCPNVSYISLNSDSVIVAYITFFPYTDPYGDSQSRSFYYNFQSSNLILFPENYNIYNYYSLLNNWQESSYTYLEQPDLVLGSHTDFESDDLTSVPSYTYGNYSNYNNYVYTIDDIDTDYALLGTIFNYNYYSDNNYKLGFVVTYRKSTDTPILVYAQTNEGTYSCNVTSVMAKNDITYQWYVECPSVDISSDENMGYLTIRVEGAYNTSSIVGPRPVWDTNDLFYTDNGVVGISPIVKSVTSVEPTPIGPGGDTTDDIIDSIDNIIDSINNSNVDDFGGTFTDFNNSIATNSVISDLLLLPITMLQNIVSSINGTCNSFNLGTIKGITITLPCIDLQAILGNTIWAFIDLVSCGIFVLVIRKRMVDIFNDLSSLKDRGNVLE